MSHFAATAYYHPSHHRQKELSAATVSLIIEGNLPLNMVEQSWFAEFMKVVDNKFKVPSRYKINVSISQRYDQKRAILRSKLLDVKHVTLTLDMWSDRRMRSYMGITVHFITPSMQLQNFLLDFAHFTGRHTGDKLSEHCANVIDDFELGTKIFMIIRQRC